MLDGRRLLSSRVESSVSKVQSNVAKFWKNFSLTYNSSTGLLTFDCQHITFKFVSSFVFITMPRHKLHNNLIFALTTYIFVIVCSSVFYNYMLLSRVEPSDFAEKLKQLEIGLSAKECYRRPLDGVCFEGQLSPIFAVMIDNHSAARPQAGVSEAALVYETIAEDPITRFMALFYLNESPEKIGPVRSARPFFVEWVKQYNVPYAHVGGSPDAMEILAKTYPFNLDEISNGQYFYRDERLDAPHNTFTSPEKLKSAFVKKQWDIKTPESSWKYSDNPVLTAQVAATSLKIDFGSANSKVEWKYDMQTQDYVRHQAGRIHKDANGGEIRAKNVIVMSTESRIVDDYGRRDTTTIGSGSVKVLYRGAVITGVWKREALEKPTKFYHDNGEEIVLIPGTTWIEVVPTYLPNPQIE